MSNDLNERLAQMDLAFGLRKECLERATYLLAMASEGQSTIMRQSTETLFKAADHIKELEDALHEVFEAWAGSEGFIPQTCPEGYLLTLTKRMALKAKSALGNVR